MYNVYMNNTTEEKMMTTYELLESMIRECLLDDDPEPDLLWSDDTGQWYAATRVEHFSTVYLLITECDVMDEEVIPTSPPIMYAFSEEIGVVPQCNVTEEMPWHDNY